MYLHKLGFDKISSNSEDQSDSISKTLNKPRRALLKKLNLLEKEDALVAKVEGVFKPGKKKDKNL